MLTTDRVVLRPWSDADAEPFAALNADPEVMRYYPSVLDRAASDAVLERVRAHHERHGFGLWAAELRADGSLLGFVGLQHVPIDTAFTPAVEIGWRLRRDAWGHGYATEAARACVDFAFGELQLSELVSMALRANTPSRRVMERLGMHYDPADDFVHREVACVLYRLAAPPAG